MADNPPQSYASHRRMDPSYHYLLTFLLLALLVLAIVHAVRAHDLSSFTNLALVIALFITAWKVRTYPLRVQDRLIRLEEQLRIKALLPAVVATRAAENLRPSQYVALRFASDEELPGLLQQTLDEDLKSEDIKKRIKTWRADDFRV